MSNPHKGEVAFESWDEKYKLSFSANALVELEEALGKTVQEISTEFMEPDKFRMKNLRVAFWAGLLDHQPDTDMTAAKRALSGLNAIEAVALVTKAFGLAFPSNEGGDDARPPQPGEPARTNGTGPASLIVGAS